MGCRVPCQSLSLIHRFFIISLSSLSTIAFNPLQVLSCQEARHTWSRNALTTYFMRVLNHTCGKCLFYKGRIVPWGCFAAQMSLMSIRRAVFFWKVVGLFFLNFLITTPDLNDKHKTVNRSGLQATCPFNQCHWGGYSNVYPPCCSGVMQGELLLCWVSALTLLLLPWELLSPLPFAKAHRHDTNPVKYRHSSGARVIEWTLPPRGRQHHTGIQHTAHGFLIRWDLWSVVSTDLQREEKIKQQNMFSWLYLIRKTHLIWLVGCAHCQGYWLVSPCVFLPVVPSDWSQE